MKQLHPGAKWVLRLRAYLVLIFISFFVTFWSFSLLFEFLGAASLTVAWFFVYVVIIFIVGEIYARMAYNRWLYEFAGSQLRTERGIIWKKYSNIPYERVQNVDVTRGIIARILGFSTVNIQTAGYSYTPNRSAFSEGYLPAVSMDEAEKIRDFLMKKISKKGRSQGL